MDVISPELPQILRLIIALIIVVMMMGGLAFLFKKLGLAAQQSIKTGKDKRLHIIETLPLDARKRLVILQCDEQQHLLILGTNSDTVIARDITSAQTRSVDYSNNSDQDT